MNKLIKHVSFDDVVGTGYLSGVDFAQEISGSSRDGSWAQTVSFRFDGMSYMATEDPEDGYRSSLKDLAIYDKLDIKNTFPEVLVTAEIKETDGEYTLTFYSADNLRPILTIGTNSTDSYYPYFVAEFMPQNMPINAQAAIAEGLTDVSDEPAPEPVVVKKVEVEGWGSW
jgi:hypothetical protein